MKRREPYPQATVNAVCEYANRRGVYPASYLFHIPNSTIYRWLGRTTKARRPAWTWRDYERQFPQ